MDMVACAVGRLGPDGSWVGFAPTLDDAYAFYDAAAVAALACQRALREEGAIPTGNGPRATSVSDLLAASADDGDFG